MRVLYHHRTLRDGAEGVHIDEIQSALRDLGHEVFEVSPVSSASPAVEPAKEEYSRRQQRIDQVKKLMPEIAVQAAHIAYNRVTRRDMLRALQSRPVDLVYTRYACFSCGEVMAARARKVPVIVEANLLYSGPWAKQHRLYFPRTASRIERYVMQHAAGIVTVSGAIKDQLVENGVDAAKIIVSPNAINPSKIEDARKLTTRESVRKQYGVDGRVVIGFVGSFRSWHGIDVLLNAIPKVLAAVPDACFLLIGHGDQLDALREKIRAEGWDNRVLLTGGMPHEDALRAIWSMDVAVMPNSNAWGSPMKVIEYMGLGRATVAPRLGPLQEVIDDGVDGVLTSPGSSEEFADAIIRLCRSPEAREQLGRAAENRILTRHTWRQNAEQIIELFNERAQAS